MTTRDEHDSIAELLGAYALDATDPHEVELVEAHLPGCPRCRDEVAGHREVAAALAFVGATAPDGLWGRIASSLDANGPAAPDLAHLYPLRPVRRAVGLRFVAAVGSIAAALIIGLAFQVHAQGRDLDNVRRALSASGLDGAMRTALLDPAAAKVHLLSDDHRVYVDAVVGPNGTGYLVGNNLPSLASGKTYQLWAVVGDRNVSLGVLGGHPAVVPFRVTAPLVALALTAERGGGVVSSQQRPVAVGFLDPSFVPNPAI